MLAKHLFLSIKELKLTLEDDIYNNNNDNQNNSVCYLYLIGLSYMLSG